jgi:putative oxygen-independent coproporphyrinogen III oxidase
LGVIESVSNPEQPTPAPIPLALYVHIPWCVRKCPYCDFNSHAVRGDLPQAAYVDALVADLETDLPRVWGRRLGSVFIGGGTPSLFEPAAVDRLLAAVRARLPMLADLEVTLEANPGTVEAGRFAELRAAGVNRLSIGVQSLDDASLAALGRIHSAAEAVAAAAAAHRAGFEDLNLDLMFGLPGQTPTMARQDLEQAIALAPSHLSYYQLTLEPNTLFHRQPPKLPGDDAIAAMQEYGLERLAAAGFEHYEVSAYARPGHRCRHNLNYWEFGDYLGIGAGAHAKLSGPDGVVRLTRLRHPQAYLEAAAAGRAVSGERRLSADDLPLEFAMNALRLVEGVPAHLFPARTGLSLASIAEPWAAARATGLMVDDPARLAPTPRGLAYLNDLLEHFVP